jgi:hypothetical protein
VVDGLTKLGDILNIATDFKISLDPVSQMEMSKTMLNDGIADARKHDMICASICPKCSKRVKQNQKFVEMKFYPSFEVRDPFNKSLIEVRYNVWQCPECKGFDRMYLPLSREHVKKSWKIGISYSQEIATWLPGFLEALVAIRQGVRDETALRKFLTVSVFKNA